MKKKKMIYLPEDREAAEILKSLTIMLKVLIKDIKECETISMLKLCTYCPSMQVIIKNKGLRKDVKTLSQS
ncbi:MAG: hypothetical protein K2G23_02445, partial [Muribaculaceae bacterium]|nr:hypothetical protein [Muribaculaceae bacterium]